jgi:TRAP-type C4-dicarboxylate transport system permease small subunit
MVLIDKISKQLNRLFVFIAAVFLLLMVVLTCMNIVLRLAGKPISGAVELMGFFGAITAAFALAYTQTKRDHISVTILFDTFPEPVKRAAGFANDTVCMLFSLMVAIQIYRIGKGVFSSGELTETLRFAFYPFVYAASAGFFMLVVIFLVELIKVAAGSLGKEPDVFEKEFEAEE